MCLAFEANGSLACESYNSTHYAKGVCPVRCVNSTRCSPPPPPTWKFEGSWGPKTDDCVEGPIAAGGCYKITRSYTNTLPTGNLTIETGPHTPPRGIMWHRITFTSDHKLLAIKVTWVNGTAEAEAAPAALRRVRVEGSSAEAASAAGAQEIEGTFDPDAMTWTPPLPERDTQERKLLITVTQEEEDGAFADINAHFESFPCVHVVSPPSPPSAEPCSPAPPGGPQNPPALAELDFIF